MAKNLYGKKKTVRNILIGVIAVLVIAAAIFLIVAMQKDGAGMNCFQRNATVATADGERVTAAEYRVTYDMIVSNYGYSKQTISEEQLLTLQENAARQVLMQKIYIKEAKALGLTITDEQKEACRKSADEQINAIEQYYASSMSANGNYSKAAVDKQMNAYFNNLGMSRSEYRDFLIQGMEADYYRQAIEAYYKEHGSDVNEEELVAFYCESVEKTMTTKDENGEEKPSYATGDFWNMMIMYQMGYYSLPMLYVPEGFIYIDYVEIQKGTAEEVNQVITEVVNGDRSFDELMNSDENTDVFKTTLKAPYPIAEKDHSALFKPDEVYTAAVALEVGQIGSFVAEPVTAEDGTTTVTAYLFRRAEGNMCYDGDHGVIKIDYFDGLRDSVTNEFHMDRWLKDVNYEDAIYAYKGALQ